MLIVRIPRVSYVKKKPMKGRSFKSERPTLALESEPTDDLKKLVAEAEAPPEPEAEARPRSNIVPAFDKAEPQRPRTSRNPTQPVFTEDYYRLLSKMGMGRFRAAFPFPFLVGVGMVGRLDSSMKSAGSITKEVLLSDLNEEPSESESLARRVWQIKEADDRRGVGWLNLGRSSLNDVVIPEFAISRKHCRFTFKERDLMVEDLGSQNGTIVNGARLVPEVTCQLKNLDVIILGRFSFQLFSPGGIIQALYDWGL